MPVQLQTLTEGNSFALLRVAVASVACQGDGGLFDASGTLYFSAELRGALPTVYQGGPVGVGPGVHGSSATGATIRLAQQAIYTVRDLSRRTSLTRRTVRTDVSRIPRFSDRHRHLRRNGSGSLRRKGSRVPWWMHLAPR